MKRKLFWTTAIIGTVSFFNSCKKEVVTPPKTIVKANVDTVVIKPRSENPFNANLQNLEGKLTEHAVPNLNAYPMNYLKIGNYWVYECRTAYGATPENTYMDSVVINAFKLNTVGDTLFLVSHYKSNASVVSGEYLQMTATGEMKNELGALLYYFSCLPEISDRNGAGKGGGCGSWYWSQFYWGDTTVMYSTDLYVLPAGLYRSTVVPYVEWEWYCGGGEKAYYLVRGIGVVKYVEGFGSSTTSSYYSMELRRFKLAH